MTRSRPTRSSSAALRFILDFAPDHSLIHPEHVHALTESPRAAEQLRVRGSTPKVPSRIRNSPTKPFSPGRPIEDSVTIKKERSVYRHTIRQAAEFVDQPRMTAVVNHADDQEQARRSIRRD